MKQSETLNAARPRVSVIVAAYNAASFLDRAVRSALDQTIADLEVLVIDDCSSDDTFAVAEAMSRADARVRPLRTQRNSGPSVARNVGIENARGEWIAVLDADDAFLSNRLRTLVELGESRAADIVADNFIFHSLTKQRAQGMGLAESDATEVLTLPRFLSGARPSGPEADYGLLKPVFRAQFLRSTGMRYRIDSRHGEDFLMIIDCLSLGAKYLLTRRPGYLYTMRDSGQSQTIVNYASVMAQSAALRDRPEFAADAEALAMLENRIASIRRLAAERELHRGIGERDVVGLLSLCFKNRHAIPAAFRWGLRKGKLATPQKAPQPAS